jgi:hypothetical protein
MLSLSAVLLFGSVYLYPWLLIRNGIGLKCFSIVSVYTIRGLKVLSAAPTANITHNANLGWPNKIHKRRADGNKVTLAIMTFSSYLPGI